MKKLLIALLLAALMPALASAEVSGVWGGLEWALDDKGTLTVSGTGTMNDLGPDSTDAWRSAAAAIERVVVGSGVTGIGDYAFYGCGSLTSVTLPDSVTAIGDNSFSDSGLAVVNAPCGSYGDVWAGNNSYTVNRTGHPWRAPTYAWADDNGTVTATVVCANDASHTVTETATVEKSITEPTFFSVGAETCTAAFVSPLFTTQTRTAVIPMKIKDAAVEAVEAQISALSEHAGPGDRDAVEAARTAYDMLLDKRAQVDPALLSRLEAAEASVQAAEKAEVDREAAERAAQKAAAEEASRRAAEEAVQPVIDAILGLSHSAGVDDKTDVSAARAAYDALTDAQKALVPADVLARLTAAEQQVQAAEQAEAERRAAEEEAAKRAAEEAARQAAEAEAARQAAEEAAAAQRAAEEAARQAADSAAAQSVIDAIRTLSDRAGLDDAEAVAAARAAYDALSDDQKALVPADVLARLTTAEQQVQAAARIPIRECSITVKDKTYTGKAITPKVTVRHGKVKLVQGTDYTLTFKDNKKIGVASVVVKGVGSYKGSVKVKFNINPKATKFSKLTGGRHQITLKWKNPKNVTGYEIEYSLKKSFSGGEKVKVKKARTLTTTIKKLKAGKTYYVRIRAYATVKKVNYYSAWSKARAVKTK